MEVRPARRTEALAIAELVYFASARADHRAVRPRPLAEQGAAWHQRLADPNRQTFVVRDGLRVVAVTSWRPEDDAPGTARLSHLFVHPDFSGHGVASSLLRYAAATMTGSYEQALLWMGEQNRRAAAVADRAGWKPTGRARFHDGLGLRMREYSRALPAG